MYHCEECGYTFEMPVIVRHWENLDGERGWWLASVMSCPRCGSEQIDETEEIE